MATDSLKIFDFDHSARIGYASHVEEANDVKGVVFTMYEIITGHYDVRHGKPPKDQHLSEIEAVDWVQGRDVLLDSPVSEYLRVLDEWRAKRQAGIQIELYTQAPNFLHWAPVPDPPLTEVTLNFNDGHTEKEMRKYYDTKRNKLLARGEPILNWQRPPQVWLDQQAGNERRVDGQDQAQQLKQEGSSEQAERALGV